MFRYFVTHKTNEGFEISKKDSHHIKNVIKLKIGEQVECVFEGNLYLTEIKGKSKDDLILVKNIMQIDYQNSNVQKILIVGVLKEQKWDYLLQKATELGVDTIVPVIFKRNVVKIEKTKMDAKNKRWQSICETASMQAKRTTIPVVEKVIFNLKELVNYTSDLNLVAWENEHHATLSNFFEQDFKSISLVVGCEGGIEPNEIEILNEIGFQNTSLGNNILRAETAPLYLLSALIFCKK